MELIDWIVGGIGIEIGRTISGLAMSFLLLPVVGIIAFIGWLIEKIRG